MTVILIINTIQQQDKLLSNSIILYSSAINGRIGFNFQLNIFPVSKEYKVIFNLITAKLSVRTKNLGHFFNHFFIETVFLHWNP